MNWQLCLRLSSLIAITSCFGASSAIALNLTTPQPETATKSLVSLEFPPTNRSGAPRTSGGGTRSNSCISSEENKLTALMPNQNNVAKTAEDTPTFYWYVPETEADIGQFVLIDEDGQEVYFNSFNLPETPSIVSLTLPDQTNLKVGKEYLWYFSVVCDERDRSGDVWIQGRLDRTQLSNSIERRIRQLTPLEQAKVYAEYRIWHETLALIEQLRSDQPEQWEELLSSVDLEFLIYENVQPINVE
jgi:hypothetical protein